MSKSQNTITIALAFAIVVATFSGTAVAQVYNLGELIDTMGEFQVEDKRFFDFSYSAIGQMPTADQINVIEIAAGGNPGFRLQAAFLDSAGVPGGSDAFLTFKVESLGPQITDVHLSGNPNLLGTEGSISVTEEVFEVVNGEKGDLIARLDIFEDANAGFKGSDWAFFESPQDIIHVEKDILGFGLDGDVVLSRIDQTFSQVPEPTASLLMLVGVAAVSMLRRKQNG